MASTDVLIGIAQISVAIVGFSGLTHVFRPDPHEWAARRSAISANIKMAAGALVFSVLPLPFVEAGLPSEYTWGICSLFFGLASAAVFGWHIHDLRRRIVSGEYYYIPATVPFSLVMIIVTVILLLNAFGVYFERSYTPYLSCLSVWVSAAAWSFGRMIHFSVFHGTESERADTDGVDTDKFSKSRGEHGKAIKQ